MPLRICFVASEITPLAKTGGLADVAGALPGYLHRQGHDVRLFMPLYASIASSHLELRPVQTAQDVPLSFGTMTHQFSLYVARLPGSDLPVYLVDCPPLYHRARLYTDDADEHVRFLLLQRAVLECCQRLRFAPQIMHCNDWHTALMPLMLKTLYAWDRLFEHTRTLMSIHNIGYQGVFPASTAGSLGMASPAALLQPEDLKQGRINWLREGIAHSHCVSTVSPTYAREICMPDGGHGLENTLLGRPDPVVGILNGVDYGIWNPATDRHLAHHYGPHDLSGKRRCKADLLERSGLDLPAEAPLLGIVSRLTAQKGLDLLFDSLAPLLDTRDCGLIALGSGDLQYENFFAELQRRYPGRVVFSRGYDDGLAHRIEAGADIFLMPSRYEPCGLNQMYSLKYGTVPIVRRTGGLADSVQMWDPQTREGTGVVFNDFDVPGMTWALHTALDLYQDREAWQQLMLNGMARDYSWEHQGAEYVQLYEKLVAMR